jgi:phage terminase large subunit-like protein
MNQDAAVAATPRLDAGQMSQIERLTLAMGPRAFHDVLTPKERLALRYYWPAWERPAVRLPPPRPPKKEPGFGLWSGQGEPPGDWIYWICCAGRGSGKSRRLTQFMIDRAQRFPGCRIALVARTTAALWGEAVDGESGLLAHAPPWFYPAVQVNKRQLMFPNGSRVKLFSGEEPDNLRGPNNHFAAVDELAAMPYSDEVWRQLQMTMRSGVHPQTMVATTPRPLKLLIRLTRDPLSAVSVGSSYENRANVAKSWLDANLQEYEGTGFGRQEIWGEILEEQPGALFRREWFEPAWCPAATKDARFRRVGIGVDPAETSGEQADSWGIVAAGIRDDGVVQVLEDVTVNDTPDVAARAAVDLYWKHEASFMVADVGRSGAMVESLMKLVDPRVRVLKKGGNKGKRAWTESVAALYSKHMVFHSPGLTKLEDECCQWTDDVKWSPDRMDALTYVVSEFLNRTNFTHESAAGRGPGRRA